MDDALTHLCLQIDWTNCQFYLISQTCCINVLFIFVYCCWILKMIDHENIQYSSWPIIYQMFIRCQWHKLLLRRTDLLTAYKDSPVHPLSPVKHRRKIYIIFYYYYSLGPNLSKIYWNFKFIVSLACYCLL